MLTLRPQLPPTRPPEWRGRSRQVSNAALARQASEQRRRATATRTITEQYTAPERTADDEKSELIHASLILDLATEKPKPIVATTTIITPAPPRPAFIPPPPSASPSPPSSASMSPDYYDSPPSPPRSLADQVHVAYALDDIHLAKVLLLKLKGIDVTSDDDPRIAAVKDEDFDFCFVPHGRLMDEADEKALEERQRMEMERLEEMRRADRLRALERIWEQEKRRLREAKALAQRRREKEAKMRVAEETRMRMEAEHRTRLARRTPQTRTRNVVTYKMVVASTASHDDVDPFLYDFMPPRPLSQGPSVHVKPHPKSQSRSPFSRPLFDDSRTVPFSDVLASMQGPLFPSDRRTTSPASGSSSVDRRRRRDAELLDSLLKVVEWEEDERRRRKGKWVEKKLKSRPAVQRKNSRKEACAACSDTSSASSSSSSSSSISPTPSRRSWLSFSSASSASSASTALTTPSTSPAPWFGKSTSPVRQQPKSWFIASPSPSTLTITISLTQPPPPPPTQLQPQQHVCKSCSAQQRVPVSLTDSPLQPPSDPNASTASPSSPIPGDRSMMDNADVGGVQSGAFGIVVGRLWELARGLGGVYVGVGGGVARLGVDAYDVSYRGVVGGGGGGAEEEDGDGKRKRKVEGGVRGERLGKKLAPPGARVCKADVERFVGAGRVGFSTTTTSANTNSKSGPPIQIPPMIPLRTRSSSPSSPFEAERAGTPPRTILPNPLPFPIVFKPLPVPCRSPFRLHAHVQACLEREEVGDAEGDGCLSSSYSSSYSSYASTSYTSSATGTDMLYHHHHHQPHAQPILRVRAVENPLHLRVKALQNVMGRRGVEWPPSYGYNEVVGGSWGMGMGINVGMGMGRGRGRARDAREGRDRETRWKEKEGMLGGGREKVVRVAWEGRGRSLLGVGSGGGVGGVGVGGVGVGGVGIGQRGRERERDAEWW
ncbi:hypothetical protein Hypma_016028 [Hypsizygus marmoreus]|uniref:Uncharacterized protein n=1 Tax=Hypsizygus marmoreus TaxID=39966 RepID=A0A369K737_HYPMA|nr:hypothetical protein Hypma_016028 [Hypsizygus marmoreus]